MEEAVDPSDFKRMGLPGPDSDMCEALWKLLYRRWFERLWIIQEVAVSSVLWVVCGNSVIARDSFAAVACLHLADMGISQWLTQRFSAGRVASYSTDLCKRKRSLDTIKTRRSTLGKRPSILTCLVDSRGAQCMDDRDRVYGHVWYL